VPGREREPVDPDVEPRLGDLSDGFFGEPAVLVAVALGGVLGSVARYEAGLMWPTRGGDFPWTVLGINVVGCALIGIVIVLATEVYVHRRLARPFLATGVLGGFTTFSAYAVDIERLLRTGHEAVAWSYLALTLVAALVSVTVTTKLTRGLVRR
jgi:CrcB protein